MKEFVFDLQRFADKITYDDEVLSFLKVLADLDKKLGLTKLADFLEADEKGDKNIEGVSSTIKFFGALYKTINKDTSLNDGAVLITTLSDILKDSVQISVDIDEGKKSANEIKMSVVKIVSKYTTVLDKMTKLAGKGNIFLPIAAAGVALSAHFLSSLGLASTDEEARAQFADMLKDEIDLAEEVIDTCIEKFFSDDLSASLFKGKVVDKDITAPLGSIALASSAVTGIISGIMNFFDEVEHYKADGIPENLAVKDALIIAVASAIKETASKYTKGFDDVAFKLIQDFMSFVTRNEVDELFADKSYTDLIIENLKTFNYKNTGTAGDDERVSYENDKMIYGYDGNDYIGNIASNVTIFGGHDNDTIFSRKGSGADYSTPQANSILGGPGNDWLIAYDIKSSVYGGNGDDRIAVYGTKNKIFGEDGKDAILFGDGADNNTANGGLGDDVIILESVKNAVIEYAEGDGNDIVLGYNESDIISITGEYSTQTSGKDVIIGVGTDSIILNDAAGKNININNKRSVIGESQEGGATIFTSLPSIWNEIVNPYETVKPDDGEQTGETVKPDDEANSKIINGKNGGDTINNDRDGMTINLAAGNNSVENSGKSVTINGGTDKDTITNSGNSVSISGGASNDWVSNLRNSNFADGENVTISGGAGDDYVYNHISNNVTITGDDGNDTLLNGTITGDSITIRGHELSIDGGANNDSICNYGSDVTINGGDGNDFIYNHTTDNVSIAGGTGNDDIRNWGNSVTIDGGTGADEISNLSSNNVTINAGDSNDIVRNYSTSVQIDGGAGNDSIYNEGDSVTIDGDEGDDTIDNNGGDNVLIDGGAGNDSIDNNGGDSVIAIDGGEGDDTIENWVGKSVTIDGGAGNDSIYNGGDSVTIDGDEGDDYIHNSYYRSNVSIDSGAGNDTVLNYSDSVTINGGDGDDSIYNSVSNVTIDGGAGDDYIHLVKLFNYELGDGNDTVEGYDSRFSILQISGDSYTTQTSGNDVIVKVGNGSITLKDAKGQSLNIKGTLDTSSGGSSSTSTTTGGGSSTSTTTGSSSTSTTRGDLSSSSVTGNSFTSTTTGSSLTSTTTGGRSSSTTRGGNSYTSTTIGGGSSSTTHGGGSSTSTTTSTTTHNTTTSTSTSSTSNVYTGGNAVISNYTSGQPITLGSFTGASFDTNGNFVVQSDSGALVIEQAVDKVIDLCDGNGNSFIKAYTASTPGIIDGRGLTGFEIINGNSAGSNIIMAGDGGSQLWGGAGTSPDFLCGGAGVDIFTGGRFQGADIFANTSSADVVNLNDASLSDIVATAEINGAVIIGFNTGNIVSIQSTEPLSAAVALADGTAWRFNHVTKSWQPA